MMFPLEVLDGHHRELGMVLAVLVGIAFGFVLERAGFGRAPKLAAQFYLHDMTVFKVMFGAIVTAMLGLVLLAAFDLLDLREMAAFAASETFLTPMIVGGFLLGIGFIISGYCPGTSIVATASGNLDGLLTIVGVVIGSAVYSELQSFAAVQSFHVSGALGSLFLYDVLGMPPALVALGVTGMALACFVGAEKVEAIFTRRRTGGAELPPRQPKRLAFAVLGGGAALSAVLLLVQQTPPAGAAPAAPAWTELSPAELAHRVLTEPWRVRILDMRSAEACVRQRVPGAECAPAADLGQLGLADDRSGRELILVGDGAEPPPAAAASYPGRVAVLQGGFPAWERYALQAPPPLAADADEAARADYRLRAGIHGMLTGTQAAAPPPPPTTTAKPRKKAGGGGCSG